MLIDRCPTLQEMLSTKRARTPSGETVDIHSNLLIDYAEALYRHVLAEKPTTVVEIGMAFGISSLAILSALDELGGNGRLISIDPNQTKDWKQCGVASVARAGFAKRHQVMEQFDYLALPQLLGSGLTIDFAYIDGWHTFDYTLLDWWYIDRMLVPKGTVAFNDCWMEAVDRVMHFVLSHRKYEEIDVGLPFQAVNYNKLTERIRKFRGKDKRMWYRQAQDRYFRKLEAWEPPWDFYAEF